MDARVLQRLRRKVGRGERLTEAELQRLRTAADLGGGATLTGREHGGLRATWTESEEGPRRQDVLSHVLPVLTAAAPGPLLAREGPARLVIVYVVDGVPLWATDEQSRPSRLEAVDAAAWRNLESRPGRPRPVIVDRGRPRLSPEPLGLWALCEADGSDGARLLTRVQRRRLVDDVGPGPYRVSLARRELALVAPLLDPDAVASLDSLEPGPDGVPGRFLLMAEGSLQRAAG